MVHPTDALVLMAVNTADIYALLSVTLEYLLLTGLNMYILSDNEDFCKTISGNREQNFFLIVC